MGRLGGSQLGEALGGESPSLLLEPLAPHPDLAPDFDLAPSPFEEPTFLVGPVVLLSGTAIALAVPLPPPPALPKLDERERVARDRLMGRLAPWLEGAYA